FFHGRQSEPCGLVGPRSRAEPMARNSDKACDPEEPDYRHRHGKHHFQQTDSASHKISLSIHSIASTLNAHPSPTSRLRPDNVGSRVTIMQQTANIMAPTAQSRIVTGHSIALISGFLSCYSHG